jgi:CheY-like chemotaxis protein
VTKLNRRVQTTFRQRLIIFGSIVLTLFARELKTCLEMWSGALKTTYRSRMWKLRRRDTSRPMIASAPRSRRILIVEDVQETRDAIRELLKRDGYRVDPAGDEDEAVERIQRNRPDLILISLGGAPEHVLAIAQRIRWRGGLGEQTPVVIFSLATVPDGAEEKLSGNIHVTMPDNFNQLRELLTRVVCGFSRTH